MKKISLIVVLTAALAGQAYAGDWNSDAVVGGAFGGAAGAAIGSALGGRDAAIVGGLLGGATGVAVATRDNQYRRVESVYYRPEPVYYRPAPVYYYRAVPVRRVYYERYEEGPRPDHWRFRRHDHDDNHGDGGPRRDFERRGW
ncbi:MAG: hypothetical protein PHZ14_02310 [Sulfuricella sp.]|jgi:hypothetical protein|nr:hypothetical protein [Sulfuricella sp.]